MAWLTWRQHRLQLLTGLVGLVSLAIAALVTELPLRSAYHRDALASCLPPSLRSGCDIIVRRFEDEFSAGVDATRALIALPALVGLFVGAPLLARELELGTARLAWTQGITRRRWLSQKLLLLALATLAGGAALGTLTMWWRHPFDAFEGRMSASVFEVEGLVVPAYALFALMLGVLAGLVLRRTVPAMTATLVAFGVTRLLVGRFLRPRFMAPIHESATSFTSRPHPGWVLEDTLYDAAGRHVTTGREDLAIVHAQLAGIDPHSYLAALGWHRVISYQPADRFWAFQAIEAGIFAALSLGAAALALWAVRRTPA